MAQMTTEELERRIGQLETALREIIDLQPAEYFVRDEPLIPIFDVARDALAK